jgi:hypothetical protein
MDTKKSPPAPVSGKVASLHLHPARSRAPMVEVATIELHADKGISGDLRYFGRVSEGTGKPSQRQVSLMEREQIAVHAHALSIAEIPPGKVRANIETTGIDLSTLIGREVQIGKARLLIHSHRDPCSQMDEISQGMRNLMENGKQGVLARVVASGQVTIGDEIRAQGSWDS